MTRRRITSAVATAAAVLFALACGSNTPPPAECAPCPECTADNPAPPSDIRVAEVPQEVVIDDEAEPLVSAGPCDTTLLPPGLVVDLSDADEASLLEEMRRWVRHESIPGLDFRHGTLYAKSEDDTGMDPPHPSWVGRNAERTCGMHQVWLRTRARDLLALHARPDMGSAVHCAENVCCYAAPMEYTSSGTFAFRRTDDGRWVLNAMVEVADNGTMGEEWVAEERTWVAAALRRQMRRECTPEPRVAW